MHLGIQARRLKAGLRSAWLAHQLSSRLPTDLIKFLIVSATRCGSNFLCGALNSHPEIVCFHELFHRKGIYYGPDNHVRYNFGTLLERDKHPANFLQRVYATNHSFEAVGLKLFAHQNDVVLAALLRSPRIKKIVLQRDNMLHAYISLQIAEASKSYQALGEPDSTAPAFQSVDVDPLAFEAFAQNRIAFFKKVNILINRQRCLRVDYASLVTESDTLDRICAFLGLDRDVELTTRHLKQNAGTLKDKVRNFDEVCAAIGGTPYARYLKNEFDSMTLV